MSTVAFSAALAFALAQPVPEVVADPHVSSAFVSCLSANEDPLGRAECYQAEQKAQDERLNAVYERLMLARDRAGKDKLREKQRYWIRAKEATCASVAIDHEEAGLGGLASAACYLRHTLQRLTWLEQQEAAVTAPTPR